MLQVLVAQEVLEGPWVAWEAVEETEEASPHEDHGAPEGTPLEEEMSSTEPEIGSVPIRMYLALQTESLLVVSPHSHSGSTVEGMDLIELLGCIAA